MSPWTGSWSHSLALRPHTNTHTCWKLSEAQFLLLFLFLANHFNVAVLPHALPQFDGTATNVLPWTNTERERTVRVPGWYQIRASSGKMQQMPCNNSCSESLCEETHRSSLSWLSRSHLDLWSSQNRSLWFFQSVCLWPPADTHSNDFMLPTNWWHETLPQRSGLVFLTVLYTLTIDHLNIC